MAADSEEEIECMFCRKSFLSRYFHTHLEMCSQHENQWGNKPEKQENKSSISTTREDPIDLIVQTLNGKQYDISGLYSYDTILNIKNKVKDEGGVSVINQRLIFNNKQLEDDKTLKHYNLKQGQLVYCIVFNYNNTDNTDNTDKQNINDHQLFLKMLNGKTVTLNVELTDKISIIKEKINKIEGILINKQVLIFCGNTLNDDKTLNDYHIKYGSIIHLIIKFDGTSLHLIEKEKEEKYIYDEKEIDNDEKKEIYIRALTGKIITISFKKWYSIKYIKSRVQDIDNIPVGKQRLVFNGKQLNDEMKCSQYNIKNKSTLQLILRLRNDDNIKYIDEIKEDYHDDDEKKDDNDLFDLFNSSGLGKLVNILQSHLYFMKENEEFIDKMLQNEDENDILKEAKQKAVETEQEILLSIMMDVISMADFMKNIVLMEDLFNNLYTKQLKIEQQTARLKYAINIDKYDIITMKKEEIEPIYNKNIDSFVKLIFSAQNIYIFEFKKWINIIKEECNKQNINIIENTEGSIKKISRAFYKSFYIYKNKENNGYKRITDILRCSLVFKSFNDIYSVFNIIDNNIEILRVKDRFKPNTVQFGYRDILINFYCPQSHIICELQLHHEVFYKYKKKSHDIYKKTRLFDYGDINYAYQYSQQYAKPKIKNNYIINDIDLNMNGKELLSLWGLNEYIKPLIDEQQWNDPLDWHFLTENDLKNNIGFNTSHFRKFMAKYDDWLKRKKTISDCLN